MLIWIRNNLFLIIAVLGVVQCSTHDVAVPVIPVEEFRSGDLVFRLGRTLESDAIAAAAESEYRYSHVGVIIERGDSLRVVHIEPERRGNERIKSEPVEVFFHPERAVRGCVVRYETLSAEQRQVLESKALELLSIGVEFDHDYALQDTSRMYCTELVDYLYRSISVSLTDRRHDLPLVQEGVILPSDILLDAPTKELWRYAESRPARHN